jgi:hypothetical protein
MCKSNELKFGRGMGGPSSWTFFYHHEPVDRGRAAKRGDASRWRCWQREAGLGRHGAAEVGRGGVGRPPAEGGREKGRPEGATSCLAPPSGGGAAKVRRRRGAVRSWQRRGAAWLAGGKRAVVLHPKSGISTEVNAGGKGETCKHERDATGGERELLIPSNTQGEGSVLLDGLRW